MALRLRNGSCAAHCLRGELAALSRRPATMSQCTGMQNLWGSCLSFPCTGIGGNTRNISMNYSLMHGHGVKVKICEYKLRVGCFSTSEHRIWPARYFGNGSSFRLNLSSHESPRKKFYSHSTKDNLLQAKESNELNRNTIAADGKGGHRHSLIELFRDSQRAKSLTARNGLTEEPIVASTRSSAKKGTSKTEDTEKKKVTKRNKKQNANEPAKKNHKTTSMLLDETEVSSSDAETKRRKKSRAKKTDATTEPATPKPNGAIMSVNGERKSSKELRPLYPPSGKSVMVVESATKAKNIQNYLGDMFDVLPSYGHVRDLAGRSGSVRPDDDFSMVWEVPSSAWTHIKTIKVALSGAKNLILATDPDREGEAIAWHLIEMLQQQDALDGNITVARVVFHEITDTAIKTALQSPRDLDLDLINAYLARRALDYLIGFSVSPLLWRKLPGCQSAGRVQSAALALICDREMEINQFRPQEYWTAEVMFCGRTNDATIMSELTHLDSKRLSQFSISSQVEAENIERRLFSSNFTVLSSKKSKVQKSPPMPYITSTLQQDSANKLHFTAAYTMKLAQKLYEGVILSDEKATGLITYMRTDGLHISDAAAKDIHSLVKERYGHNFASKDIRKYFKKVKNAQEAHEAIRPTSIQMLPSSLAGILDDDSLKLYTLIWTRTMACQMEAAVNDLVQVDIGNPEGDINLRSSASQISFLGYQVVYKDAEAALVGQSSKEESCDNESFKALTALKVKEQLQCKKVQIEQHHSKPPGRYSEGSLVKKLEELGIGRPSTYAPILKVLQDRKYVTIKSRVLYPEFRGRMVSAFLSHHFSEVSDYSFTADMENELDNVSAGVTEWKGLMKDYWSRFKKYCDIASNVNIRQLEKMLEKKFGHILFSSLRDKSRTCPSCSEGTLVFKVSRYGTGYFIGCDQHPKCKYIAETVANEEDDDDDGVETAKPETSFEPRLLGHHPGTNEKILLKKGPYGYYVQLGEDRKESPPKRSSVSEVKDIDSFTLEDAIELLRYPITLGNHPGDDQPVMLAHSKYGYSVRHKRTIAQVPKSKDPKNITLEVALKLLSSKKAKQTGRPVRKPKIQEAML